MRPIYYIHSNVTGTEAAKRWADALAEAFHYESRCLHVECSGSGDQLSQWELLNDFVEEKDVAVLVFELVGNNHIQFLLDKCRELRVPYLMVRDNQPIALERIALPVTFLMEEKEKGQFAAAFGRFFHSEILIFAPKDYGSKARRNIASITKLLDTFSLKYTEHQAEKNSEKVEMEATLAAPSHRCGLAIVTASREYGLDDILFGCKEKKILKKTSIPVMLINPRGDLYSLCD